jgi:L-threonylcarbamoyladenylate synthase
LPRTLHLDASSPAHLALAANLLRDGHLVAFPTETVYGLGANALSEEAVAKIFAAKRRPSWDPLIVHIASTDLLPTITDIPPHLSSLISHLSSLFWPGPLTLLLPRTAVVPNAVTANRELVGVRVPAHPSAHALLSAAGVPIAAPSANRFGHTSPTTAQHVFADLDGRIAAVLDAGPTSIGLESTVLDPTQTPMVLYRPGAITAHQITAATGVPVHLFTPEPTTQTTPPQSLPSPGVGIRHYAPRASLHLTQGSELALEAALQTVMQTTPQQKVGVLLPTNWRIAGQAEIEPWGPWDDPATLAATLFSALRHLDDLQVDAILCPLPPPGNLNDAIRDRLTKAARPT